MEPRYIVAIQEDGVLYPRGNPFSDLEEAKAKAMKQVDDALPRNTVYVLRQMGYAYLTGDGETEWKAL